MIGQRPSVLRTEFSGAFVACLYVEFGLADLICSLTAFRLGFPELNPFLGWLAQYGLFVPVKLAMTGVIGVLIARLYTTVPVRIVAWSGTIVMVAVTVYHLLGLSGAL